MKQKQNCQKFNEDFKNGSHFKKTFKKLVKKNKNILWGLPWWFIGRLHTSNAGGTGLIPKQELRSCVPHSATNNNNFCIFINTLFSKTSCSFTFL